jgi:O-antigen/teichoic acid export membrane protein
VSDLGNEHQDVVTIARGGSIAFVGRLFSMALGYVLAAILARGLGAGDYGLFVIGFSLVNLIGSFSILGLNRGTVRFVALYRGIGDRGRELGTFRASLAIVLLSGLVSAGLLVVLAEPLAEVLNTPSEFANYLWGFACWIPLWALIYQLAAAIEALKRLEYRAIIVDVGWPLMRVLLSGGVLLAGGRLVGVVGANLVASVIALVLVGLSVYRLFFRELRGVHAVSPVRQLLIFSLPVMLFNLLNISQNQIEIYLLAALCSSEATGIFNVAARTSVLTVAFLEGLGFIFSPFVSDLTNRRQVTELKSLMSTVTRWSFMFGLPISLAMILFSRPILHIFGNAFVEAVPALIILSIAQLINAATGPVGVILTMSGHPNLNLLDSILTLGLNIVLNVLLIPPLGILGAAIGSGIATSLVNLLRTLQVLLVLRIWAYDRQFVKPLIAAAVAAGITYVAVVARGLGSEWLNLGVGLGILGVVYVGGILVLGLSQSDVLILKTLRERVFREVGQA